MPTPDPATRDNLKEPVVFFRVTVALAADVTVPLFVVKLVVLSETTLHVPELTVTVALGDGPEDPERVTVMVL